MFILQHSKITFYMLLLLGKSLGGCSWPLSPGLDTGSFGLGFGICVLTASALRRIPLGTMTSVTF